MQCRNHADVAAVDRCVGCAESFCHHCLVEIQGQKYCGGCKLMAVKGGVEMDEDSAVECADADSAFKMALGSYLCVGFILGPMAISKGLAARRKIENDPTLYGWGKATGAIILGGVALVLFVLNFLARFSR